MRAFNTSRSVFKSAAPEAGFNARITIWGQSNAEGTALRSGTTTSPLSTDPDLADYDDGTLTFSRVKFWNGTAYATLVPGSNAGTAPTIMGPELGLAVRWMRETAAGTLYLAKNTQGGTSVQDFQTTPGFMWTAGLSKKSAQDAWLTSNSVSIDAANSHWYWSQAEADSGQSGAWYEPKLQDVVDGVIAQGILGGRGVLTDINTGSTRYNSGISAAKASIASGSSGVVDVILELNQFESDGLHINAYNQVQTAFDAYTFLFNTTPLTI